MVDVVLTSRKKKVGTSQWTPTVSPGVPTTPSGTATRVVVEKRQYIYPQFRYTKLLSRDTDFCLKLFNTEVP